MGKGNDSMEMEEFGLVLRGYTSGPCAPCDVNYTPVHRGKGKNLLGRFKFKVRLRCLSQSWQALGEDMGPRRSEDDENFTSKFNLRNG